MWRTTRKKDTIQWKDDSFFVAFCPFAFNVRIKEKEKGKENVAKTKKESIRSFRTVFVAYHLFETCRRIACRARAARNISGKFKWCAQQVPCEGKGEKNPSKWHVSQRFAKTTGREKKKKRNLIKKLMVEGRTRLFLPKKKQEKKQEDRELH